MDLTTRRDFLKRAAAAGGLAAAAAVVPFSFVRAATLSRPRIDRFMAEQRRAMASPGLSAAVVSASGLEWAGGYGWANLREGIRANADTVYMLASISKTVACAGVMSVVEDGGLDLDADVNDVLPFEVSIPDYPGAITLRHLLTHTSSIRDRYSVWGNPGRPGTLYSRGDSTIALGDFLRSYLVPGEERYERRNNFYNREPGTSYSYSNIGVDLAAYAAEVVTGTDFAELCSQRVFAPLGMEQTGYRLADITTENLAVPYRYDLSTQRNRPIYQYGYPDYPCGALRTSAVQLAKWLRAFMNFGELDGARILERSTVRQIRANQHVASWNQGLIWYSGFTSGYRRMGHTGGDVGVSTRMFFRPDRRIGVITLSNSGLGGPRYAEFHDVERHLFEVFS